MFWEIKKLYSNFNELEDFLLPPLISAAAVLRNEKKLRDLLSLAKSKKIKAKKIYEALLQTYLFAGFPSALISLKIYGEYFTIPKSAKILDSYKNYYDTGIKTNQKIYGRNQSKLLGNVEKFSPELSKWLIIEGYGKVLSRIGLSLKERELCIIAQLTALKFEVQLYSHIIGAFKQKAKYQEVYDVINCLNYFDKSGIVKLGVKVLDKYMKNNNGEVSKTI